jgi:hypothetical protein
MYHHAGNMNEYNQGCLKTFIYAYFDGGKYSEVFIGEDLTMRISSGDPVTAVHPRSKGVGIAHLISLIRSSRQLWNLPMNGSIEVKR